MKVLTVIEAVQYMLTLNVRLEDGYALNQDIRVVTCLAKSPEAFNCGTKPSIELFSSAPFFSNLTFYTLDQKQEQVKLLSQSFNGIKNVEVTRLLSSSSNFMICFPLKL